MRAASSDESAARALLPVRIYDNAGVSVADIIAAQTAAADILRAAGITPVWIQCPGINERRQSSRARCEMTLGPAEVVVRILRSPYPDSESPVPLGEAMVDLQAHVGAFATVFADRVASLSGRAGTSARHVLGRVIAHEIGHLLLGTNHHATRGLMRAVWTDQELRRNLDLYWRFSASEARCMRERITERANRIG